MNFPQIIQKNLQIPISEDNMQEIPNLAEQWKKIPNTPSLNKYENNNYIYVESQESFNEFLTRILQNETCLGIDIEQTNDKSYFGKICLVQISTPTKNYLIDTLALKSSITSQLAEIFQNENIVKVFYSGQSDLLWLQRDFKIKVENFFDVKLASQSICDKKEDLSLAGLLEKFCGEKIDRQMKKKMQISEWWQRPLSDEQKNYAALDSYYLIYLRHCILSQIIVKFNEKKIYDLLCEMKQMTEKKYEPKNFSEKDCLASFHILCEEKKLTKNMNLIHNFVFLKIAQLRDIIARKLDVEAKMIATDDELVDFCFQENLIEKKEEINFGNGKPNFFFENKEEICKILNTDRITINQILEKINLTINNSYDERNNKKLERRKKIEDLFTRKTPAYENCSILAPDGMLLCHCDKKKIQWYLSRGLAEPYEGEVKTPSLAQFSATKNKQGANIVTEKQKIKEIKKNIAQNVSSIKLLFEPQGRGFSELEFIDHKFYTVDRANQCVVCGNSQKYLKFHIVPLIYRQYFPNSFKSHRSHDVVLLCFRCHEAANKEVEKLRIEIAKEFDVPLFESNEKLSLRNNIISFTKLSLSFVKNKETLPKDRRKNLKQNVREIFLQMKDLEVIQKTPNLIDSLKTLNYNSKNEVKIDANFVTFCTLLNKSKNSVKDSSNKEFKNQHGRLVVEKMKDNQEIKDFILKWRRHFIAKLNPQFLPQAWNVYHQFERKFGKMSRFNDVEEEKKQIENILEKY